MSFRCFGFWVFPPHGSLNHNMLPDSCDQDYRLLKFPKGSRCWVTRRPGLSPDAPTN